jgi:hypothetical protein
VSVAEVSGGGSASGLQKLDVGLCGIVAARWKADRHSVLKYVTVHKHQEANNFGSKNKCEVFPCATTNRCGDHTGISILVRPEVESHDTRLCTPSCSGTGLHLQDECTTFHRVDEDVAALEQSIAGPCADEINLATTSHVVILRIDVKESDLFDPLAGRIRRDGADVEDAETSAVVRLVCKSVRNVLFDVSKSSNNTWTARTWLWSTPLAPLL